MEVAGKRDLVRFLFLFFFVANVGQVFGSVTDDASVLGFFPWA